MKSLVHFTKLKKHFGQKFPIYNLLNFPEVLLSRNLSTKTDEQITNTQQSAITDDFTYFKLLGKTTNPYWINNGQQLFNQLDWKHLIDLNCDHLTQENLRRRFCDDKVNLQTIRSLWTQLESCEVTKRGALIEKLVELALWVPNDTHPASLALKDDIPLPLSVYGEPPIKQDSVVKPVEFQKYCEKRNLLRNENLGNLTFHRGYYLRGPLAELEDALVRFSLASIKDLGFQLISVPDILYSHIIEGCGMKTRGERDQVFWLDYPFDSKAEVCLSGTSEMAIGGSFQNTIFELDELPLKLVAVSRCHRAETSSLEEEKGLYRVHEFTKVELFGITSNESGCGLESENLHQEFRKLEESNFSQLGLHFKTLEMPPGELGLPAYRKFDIEAWMPGRGMFGEISSCSNCTDFQSKRLNIRYRSKDGQLKFVHSVNGTAMAIPRMLIALIENCQQGYDGELKLPVVLEKFMTRSWEKGIQNHKRFKSMFLKNKSSMEKYTKRFRNMEL